MNLKREMFIFFLLFLLIFSISVVSANEKSLNDSSTDELILLSNDNNMLAKAINDEVDSDTLDDSSADLSAEDTENQEIYESKIGQKNLLGASNVEETPLRAAEVHANSYFTANTLTFNNLETLIDQFDNKGGTLYLDGKTFNQNTQNKHISINKNINIYGGSSATSGIATLDAKGLSRFFDFNHMTGSIKNVVMKNSGGTYQVASMWINASTLDISNVILQDLTTKNSLPSGMSIYSNSKVTFTNVTVKNVTAIYGIDIVHSTFICNNSTIANCNVRVTTLRVNYGNFIIDNIKILNNRATQTTAYAGMFLNGIGTIKNSYFFNNSHINPNDAGRALQVNSTDLTKPIVIDGCVFIKNGASEDKLSSGLDLHAGALCMYNNAILKNSYFENNYGSYGGAVTIHANGTIDNCIFINNYALRNYGGAISTGVVEKDITVNITNCYFEGNQAPKGGAVELKGENIHVINCEFYNNSAIQGGACYIRGSEAIIQNSTFEGNNATYNLTINGLSNFRDKVDGGTLGGAVFIIGDDAKILNNTFENNEAAANKSLNNDGLGGAIYVHGNYSNTNNNTFNHNKARNGSAIYTDGTNFNLVNDTFYQNQAWSYLLITTAVPEESYFNEKDINVTVVHVGGDNIINAIYNKATNDQIHFTNVHYTDSRHGNTTTGTTSVTPVNGAENSNDGELLYQDSREDYQNINLIIKRQEDGEEVFNDTVITDIYGNFTKILSAGLRKGNYTVYARHPEDWNYKQRTSTAEFRINYSLRDNKTASNETPYYGAEIEFNLTIINYADAVYSDNINSKRVMSHV